MNRLHTLIFDVDGTLADTERDGHRVAFNRAFAEAGLDWDWSVELYSELLTVTGGKERIRFYIEQYHPDFPITQEFIVDLHTQKNKYYQELLTQGKIPLRPGVKRLIQEAVAQGVRLAVATTSDLPNVMVLLEQALEPSWFEVIAAGDMVPAKKPAPDIYYYVLEKLNLNAQNCLAVEDSHHGLSAATAAGLPTIITVNDYTQGQDFSQALSVLSHLGEPELPCTVIAGKVLGGSYVDIETLERLLSST